MSPSSNKLVFGSMIASAVIVLCIAIFARAQYNSYDSELNSGSDGGPSLSSSELGKLVRNSGRASNQMNRANYQNQQPQYDNRYQSSGSATKNLYNKQQAMQFAPTHHDSRRQFRSEFNDFNNPGMMGAAASQGARANSDDDDESGNFGPNMGSNFDGSDNDNDGEGASNADRQPMNLNQAASGYPGDYNENVGAQLGGFDSSPSSYGPPSGEGSEFGPSDIFGGGDGRRAKSASSMLGSRNYGSDDDTGAPQYGPNSAINTGGEGDDEERSRLAPESQGDIDNDDE